MNRLSIAVTKEEREALCALGLHERRDPREQAALLIRQALEQAGWLKPVQPPFTPLDEERTQERERYRA